MSEELNFCILCDDKTPSTHNLWGKPLCENHYIVSRNGKH
jgi:hypothetical protein